MYYCWWLKYLHHLGCMKPYKQWDKLPTSTGDRRISAKFLYHPAVVYMIFHPICPSRSRRLQGDAWKQHCQWLKPWICPSKWSRASARSWRFGGGVGSGHGKTRDIFSFQRWQRWGTKTDSPIKDWTVCFIVISCSDAWNMNATVRELDTFLTRSHHKIWTDFAGFASQQSARSTLQGFWTQSNCSNTLGPKTQSEGHLMFRGEVKSSNSTVWL